MPLISDSIGRVLGKRYRLVSALGTGASAHVFLAEDVSLRRLVAVKVLLPALARDASFLKRFGAEARSVAALNHPHVLSVFDWGEDVDGPYLVLEYLEGGSLREVLDRGLRLSHAQAARLGAEAAQGLAYAHARGLVHRDVKPANLLFDGEGRVRVADFGVARAVAEASWTEPAGAMVGTARYASPEQVQGRAVDGRADVYSLSLVLYEALTGEVPFVADTTVATLMARVGASLPRHPGLGPLEGVLALAAAPDPEARLDAAGLAARLEEIAAGLPAPAPLLLSGHGAGGRSGAGFTDHRSFAPGRLDPTTVQGSADATLVVDGLVRAPEEPGLGRPGGEAARPGAGLGPRAPEEPGLGRPGGEAARPEVFDIEALEGLPAAGRGDGSAVPPAVPPSVRRRRRRTRWPWAAGAAVLVLVVAGGLVLAAITHVLTPSHPVPTLAGRSLVAASRAAGADHFSLAVAAPVFSTSVPAGIVVSQDPSPGVSRKQGSTVHVVPSKGLPTEALPSLSGLDCATATAKLQAAHFKAACPALLAYSPTIPSGQVINWSYAGTLDATAAPYGSTVEVAVSKGKPPVAVPPVAGDTSFAEAQSALGGVGLQATEAQTSSTTVPAGQVIGTTPAAGALATVGTTVTVDVSTGPPVVTVPTVVGDSAQAATAAMQAAGLTVSDTYGPPGGTVFTTSPLAGQQVRKGSSVSLYTQ